MALELQIEEAQKARGLNTLEKVKKFAVETKPWTEDDLLTPTMNLKRHLAKEKYEREITELY